MVLEDAATYEGKAGALFAGYAVPQMVGMLFNTAYVIVDGVFIGNRLGRDDEARRAFNAVVAVAGAAGILIAVAGNVFLAPLAEMLGPTPRTRADAQEYLWYVAFSPHSFCSAACWVDSRATTRGPSWPWPP